MKRFILLILLAGCFSLPSLGADTPVGEVVRLALENSRDIEKARRAADDAREALATRTDLENTRVNLGGSLAYGPTGPTREYDLSTTGDASLSVPIVPQVSLSGRINSGGTGSVSLSLSPFAAGFSDPKKEEAYTNALIDLRYTQAQEGLDAERAAFDLLLRQMDLEKTGLDLDYQQRAFDVVEQRYDLGDASYDDYLNAKNQLSSMRRGVLDGENRLLNAGQSLRKMLGPDVEAPRIEPLTLDELLGMVAVRREAADRLLEEGRPSSRSLEQLEAGLERLRADLKRTWLWRPNLSVSASVDVPLEDFQASVSLSFSLSDLKTDEREDLEQSIEEQVEDISLERYDLQVETDIRRKSVSISTQALEADRLDLEQSLVSLEEAVLLAEQGYMTDLELEQTRLQLRTAEIRLFSSAYELYDVLGQLLLLYVGA